MPQSQLEAVLAACPNSFDGLQDFPLSEVWEISRLRFTSLEMTRRQRAGGIAVVSHRRFLDSTSLRSK